LCGVVGLRPTQGALPMTGVFPLSTTLDTVGPIAATVAHTALLWSALTGRPTPTTPITSLRVGVVCSDATDDVVPTQADALTTALAALTAAGCTLSDVPLPELPDWARDYLDIIGPEAHAHHADRLRQAPDAFEPEVLARLTKAAEVPAWRYVTALRTRARLLGAYPERAGVDMLVLPTVPIEAPPIGARATDLGAGWTDPGAALLALNSPWSLLGVPAISVPLFGAGMPASVQLVGKAGGEAQLLAAAKLIR